MKLSRAQRPNIPGQWARKPFVENTLTLSRDKIGIVGYHHMKLTKFIVEHFLIGFVNESHDWKNKEVL
ncbi:hypothetical protein QL285_064750 [Trifolium repens]|nr:hypothetical protein QL285_064750 [Trifolium repens]